MPRGRADGWGPRQAGRKEARPSPAWLGGRAGSCALNTLGERGRGPGLHVPTTSSQLLTDGAELGKLLWLTAGPHGKIHSVWGEHAKLSSKVAVPYKLTSKAAHYA